MTTTIELTAKDFKGKTDPDWCPGCGDFGVLNAMQRACAELGLKPHEIPLGFRDHALFAAYAPAQEPEIVVVAVAEHAGSGGGVVAAPMAQKVLARYFEKKARLAEEPVSAVSDLEPGSGGE